MTGIPEAEVAAGVECYATTSEPCSGRIKGSPEDFLVEEVAPDLEVVGDPRSGYVPLYRVEKRSIDTLHMERELGEALKSRVRTAGLKDKRALAVQYATPTSTRSESPEVVRAGEFSATRIGYVARPLSRGSSPGNAFVIIVRDCGPRIHACAEETLALGARHRIPNFFGLQRFGGSGSLTHRVGKLLILGDFGGAVALMLLEPRGTDSPGAAEAREEMRAGRFDVGARLLPHGMDLERLVASNLAKKPGDFVNAIRGVPIRVRRLYTQAYQSYLFNRTLSRTIETGLDIGEVKAGDNWGEVAGLGLVSKIHGVGEPAGIGATPLVQLAGFACRNYGSRFDSALFSVLDEEGVSRKSFYLKDMDEVSVEGGFRRPGMFVEGASVESGGGTATFRFTLGRGSYATVFMREVLKPRDPVASGFA
ncbi:MAG: tRNA pseudouridine(13) synthase TruD [Thaumarchaeota archaeon]|nr:tRNA pseudouridine(13) synthase TruD [Nitrososphaerota archaeon]